MRLVSDGLGSASNGRHCPEPKPMWAPDEATLGDGLQGDTGQKEGRGAMDRWTRASSSGSA